MMKWLAILVFSVMAAPDHDHDDDHEGHEDLLQDSSIEALNARCRDEVNQAEGDPTTKENVLAGLTRIKREELKDIAMANFPGMIDEGPPMKLKDTDVTVHFDGGLQREFCKTNPMQAAYTTYKGQKIVVFCVVPSKKSVFLDQFRHEAIHAVQFNSKRDPPEAFKQLHRYLVPPDGKPRMAEQLAPYTMPSKQAATLDGHNANTFAVFDQAEKSIKGSKEELSHLFGLSGSGRQNALDLLTLTGKVTVKNRQPVELSWEPAFEAEGGERKYKEMLRKMVKDPRVCPSGQTGGCFFQKQFSEKCGHLNSSSDEDVYSCLNKFAKDSLRAMEALANKKGASGNASAVLSMVDAMQRGSCTGLVTYCTETQANFAASLDKVVLALNVRSLKISDECQAAALGRASSKNKGQRDPMEDAYQAFDSGGWGALQKVVQKQETERLRMGYGADRQSMLSGYGTFEPSMCRKLATPDQCHSRDFTSSTGAVAPAADGGGEAVGSPRRNQR
ncbi:MAG: hypothetical protein KF789_13375 [Bdellovibrionaceae bacterium]|nr:hypothetical protein [Pseudobdellovibrionaceae bacterium]